MKSRDSFLLWMSSVTLNYATIATFDRAIQFFILPLLIDTILQLKRRVYDLINRNVCFVVMFLI